MIKALYDCTKGIIDQLIGIYTFMQIDYIRKSKKPVVDANYVYATAEKHYKGIQKILSQISDPEYEAQRAELAKAADAEIDGIVKDAQAKESAEAVKQINQSGDASRMAQLKSNVVAAIMTVTSDYTQDTIEQAFNRVIRTKSGQEAASDQTKIVHLVFQKLSSGKTDKRPKTAKPDKSETNASIRDYLKDDTTDDLL